MDNQLTTGTEKSSGASARRPRSKRSQGTPLWVANVIMLVLGIIIGGVGHWLLASAFTTASSSSGSARHFKGNPNAPVTIIEFGDFQ